jgi:uncharacterized membrane protein (TIGR02234 family)
MTRRPGQRAAFVLLGGGALVALLGFGQTWVTITAQAPGLPATVRTVSGRELEPGAAVLPILLGAAVLACWAVSGVLRRLVGVVALVAALVVVLAALRSSPALLSADLPVRFELVGSPVTAVSWWWLPTAAGGVLALAGAALVVARGGQWRGMSSRYQRRSATVAAAPAEDLTARETWDLLDAGSDPTAAPAAEPVPDAEVPGAAPGRPGAGTMRAADSGSATTPPPSTTTEE